MKTVEFTTAQNKEAAVQDARVLDIETVAALKEYFTGLTRKVSLLIYGKSHSKYGELLFMMSDLKLCSGLISVVEVDSLGGLSSETFAESQGLGLKVYCEDRFTGVAFAGIPGGHEFSSLVLAIMQTSGLGKALDPIIVGQVAALRGPVKLRTFVSLSCENCPDVIQMLNQMALSQEGQEACSFENTMIDGDLAESEVKRLRIGAVPAVYAGDRLICSGKVTMLEMLEKLKDAFGVVKTAEKQKAVDFDLLVVGGGPAGVSAAIYSARKGLRTALVAERMGGQVADTQGIENMISKPYTVGSQLVADFQQHVATYEIKVFEHRRVESFLFSDQKSEAVLSSGEKVGFKRLIFATGAKWRELGVPGEKEYLGRGVAFCPHCDGPLFKKRPVAVIGGGNSGVEAALDLSAICSKVTLIEFAPDLKADQVLVSKLRATANIHVVTNAQTTEIIGDGQSVTGIRYLDRDSKELRSLELDGVFVQIGLLPNSQILRGHVDMTPSGEIVVDSKCRTSRKGVYAAGDVTTVPFKQIVVSLGEGAKAALTAFEEQMLA